MRFETSLTRASLALGALLAGACTDPSGPGIDDPEAPEVRLANVDFVQIDRFGLPAIATVFIPTTKKDAYNTGAPAADVANFSGDVVAVLTAFGHPDPAALAAALLPDVQPFNTGSPTGFLNGRRPADDVITAELGLIFGANPGLNDDHVDANDRPFLPAFPYFAGPHGS